MLKYGLAQQSNHYNFITGIVMALSGSLKQKATPFFVYSDSILAESKDNVVRAILGIPQTPYFVTISSEHRLTAWLCHGGKFIRRCHFETDCDPLSLCIDPEGRLVIAGTIEKGRKLQNILEYWDISSGVESAIHQYTRMISEVPQQALGRLPLLVILPGGELLYAAQALNLLHFIKDDITKSRHFDIQKDIGGLFLLANNQLLILATDTRSPLNASLLYIDLDEIINAASGNHSLPINRITSLQEIGIPEGYFISHATLLQNGELALACVKHARHDEQATYKIFLFDTSMPTSFAAREIYSSSDKINRISHTADSRLIATMPLPAVLEEEILHDIAISQPLEQASLSHHVLNKLRGVLPTDVAGLTHSYLLTHGFYKIDTRDKKEEEKTVITYASPTPISTKR